MHFEFFGTAPEKLPGARQTTRPMMEALEGRQLLSATAPAPAVVTTPADLSLSVGITIVSPKTDQALPGRFVTVALQFLNTGNALATATATTTIAASVNSDGSSPIFAGVHVEHLRINPGKHETFNILQKIPVGSVPATYDMVANSSAVNTLNTSDVVTATVDAPTTLTVLDPYPVLAGYSGVWTVTRGPDKGLVATQVGEFTEDDTNGTFVSEGTNYYADQTTQAVTGAGFITTTGVFKEGILHVTNYVIGRLVHGVIRGTFVLTTGDSGTLAWTMTG